MKMPGTITKRHNLPHGVPELVGGPGERAEFKEADARSGGRWRKGEASQLWSLAVGAEVGASCDQEE